MHIVYTLPSLDIGGMEHFVVTLAAQMNAKGHRTTVLCTSHAGDLAAKAEGSGTTVLVEPVASILENVLPMRIRDRLRGIRPDVVHTQTGTWLPGIIGARLAGIRAVCHTEHGLEVDETPKLRLVRATTMRLARRIVAVSTPLQVELARQIVVRPKRIHRIDNGIDVAGIGSLRLKRESVRMELNVSESTIIIGAVARLNVLKGLDVLLSALPLLSRDAIEILVVIAGDGEERAGLERQAEALRIPVRFLGRRSDATRLMQGFDIFVMPSRSEGLPLALLEAMASERAIVASRVGEIPTALRDGAAGLLTQADDPNSLAEAIRRLIDDIPLRKRLGAEALAVVTNGYSLDAMVSAYEHLYASIVRD